MKYSLSRFFESMWYGKKLITPLFLPLSGIFYLLIKLRAFCYKKGWFKSKKFAVPIIVVGNITVGGTGKTPVVIYIAQVLKAAGYSPGIISRGYGGIASSWPQQVRPDSDARVVGDEAKVLAIRTQCPVAVGPKRVESAQALIDHYNCDVIVSDDGLQHYALQRDIEIALVDGERRSGNGFLLPAGPLREQSERLSTVDFVICNGLANAGEFTLRVEGDVAVSVMDESVHQPLKNFQQGAYHAVAALGNPSRFFTHLKKFGLNIIPHTFPDHFQYQSSDINFNDGKDIFMTEKDAVKCTGIANEKHWYVPIKAMMPEAFGLALLTLIKERNDG